MCTTIPKESQREASGSDNDGLLACAVGHFDVPRSWYVPLKRRCTHFERQAKATKVKEKAEKDEKDKAAQEAAARLDEAMDDLVDPDSIDDGEAGAEAKSWTWTHGMIKKCH